MVSGPISGSWTWPAVGVAGDRQHQAVHRLALVAAHLLALKVRDHADPERALADPPGVELEVGPLEHGALRLDEAGIGAYRGEAEGGHCAGAHDLSRAAPGEEEQEEGRKRDRDHEVEPEPMKDAEGNAHADPEQDEALGGEQGSRGDQRGEEPAVDGLAADRPRHRGAQNDGVDRRGEDEHEVAGVVPDHARQPPRRALRGRKPEGPPSLRPSSAFEAGHKLLGA
jgi:hypothetical protein